jgi:hypothetical protein
MSLELLTIVIPTRDRPEFLEKCLRSVFERQMVIPQVVVSDNSTCDVPAVHTLQRQYQFAYVRQSGKLSQASHFNVCMLELPSTPWVLLLHDDDELHQDCVRNLESFLAGCQNVGIVMAGVQNINQHGEARERWIPKQSGTFKGEEGLLSIGLDGCAYPPGTIFGVMAARQFGGFTGIDGIACDYLFALQLAYHHGVAFFPEIVGRYRSGPQQIFQVATPAKAASWLDFELQQVKLMRAIRCSAGVLERLIDYRTWSVFLSVAPYCLQSHPSSLLRLARKCMEVSPQSGEWQNRARKQYPFLFSRLRWHSWSLLRTAKTAIPVPWRRWVREAISR